MWAVDERTGLLQLPSTWGHTWLRGNLQESPHWPSMLFKQPGSWTWPCLCALAPGWGWPAELHKQMPGSQDNQTTKQWGVKGEAALLPSLSGRLGAVGADKTEGSNDKQV